MTRLLFLAAVMLACLAWPCSAEAETPQQPEGDTTFTVKASKKTTKRTKIPKRPYTVYFTSDVPDVMEFVGMAREQLKLAKSAETLAKSPADPSSKDPFNATAEVLKIRTRAENAMNSLQTIIDNASPFAKAAAEVAKELYDNDTAIPLLTDKHQEWFGQRFGNATAQEAQMIEAIRKLENASKGDFGMHPLIMAVLTPAKSIYKLAHDAKNDARHIVRKRVFTEMLAERIESLHELANTENAPAEASCTEKTNSESNDAAEVSKHRNTAAKAYLLAASAQKIAASCVTRIKGNITLFDKTYYELMELLAKMRREDYKEMRVYKSIADQAHADAEECEQIAAGTPEYAEAFVKTAKTHLDSITSCTDVAEAKWRAGEAQKASQKALDEMQYALYQLFDVTVSVQQVTDAKKAVTESKALEDALKEEKEFEELLKKMPPKKSEESKNAETTPTGKEGEKELMKRPVMKEKTEEEKAQEKAERGVAMREAKKKAVEIEKEAEKSYDAVRAHADMAANTVQHVTDIVNQVKQLAAQVPADKKTEKKTQIDAQLTKAQTALQTANQSSNTAQAAEAVAFNSYNKTKSAVDSALKEFEKPIVEHLQKTADETVKAAKKSMPAEEQKAKSALDEVEKQKAEALAAHDEMNKLVEALGKKDGFGIFKVKIDRAGDRDSATAPSLLHVSVAALCVMAVSIVAAV